MTIITNGDGFPISLHFTHVRGKKATVAFADIRKVEDAQKGTVRIKTDDSTYFAECPDSSEVHEAYAKFLRGVSA